MADPDSGLKAGSQRVKEVLSLIWWIYIIIMSRVILFSGGIEEFFIGIVAMLVLLILPLIFYK